MLQKPKKAVYNRLSRRQVLRVFGVGMGAMAVGAVSGCTTYLNRIGKIDQTGAGGSIPLSTTALFPKTYRAMKSLNKHYLYEKTQKLKQIVRSLKKIQGDPTILTSEAHRIGHVIVDHWSTSGVLLALDQDLRELLLARPELLVLPLPGTDKKVRSLQIALGLTDDDTKGWEERLKWDKAQLLKAIERKGSEYLWRDWLDKSFGFKRVQPQQVFTTAGPIVVAGALLLIVLVLVHSCDCSDLGGCDGHLGFFDPPPPPPPPPGCFVKGTLVATLSGLKPIEQIRIGDDIYAFDLRVQDLVPQKVIQTLEVREEEILVLDFGAEKIRCTPLHQFYTGQWIPAKELDRGDRVLSLEGSWKELKEIRREVESQSVFNLHLNETHNYFAGGILSSEYKTP